MKKEREQERGEEMTFTLTYQRLTAVKPAIWSHTHTHTHTHTQNGENKQKLKQGFQTLNRK